MTAPAIDSEERAALIAVAELLGQLLLHEVDSQALVGLRALGPDASSLTEGLPEPAEEQAWLEELAAEYHDRFLGPGGTPLVQSLWTEGRFEGAAAGHVAELARAAGLEHDSTAARGAVRDHLGCLLLLWAKAVSDPWSRPVADELARSHLSWAGQPLQRLSELGGFYGSVADMCTGLITCLLPGVETAPKA